MGDKETCFQWLIKAIAAHDSDDCLMWPFKKDEDGYGRVWFEGKTVGAHRLAFKIANGEWPKPYGLHTCDTPGCVNPRHIWAGDDKTNHEDQVTKGRTTKGTMQACAKLTEANVEQCRQLYATGKISMKALAEQFGVSVASMRFAIRGGTHWKHVDGAVSIGAVRRFHATHCKKGHEFTIDNYYLYDGSRQCKECTRMRQENRKSRRTAK